MKLLLLQTDIHWLEAGENRRRAEELIENALSNASEGVDLIVLPEMFTTGFMTEPAGSAEQAGSDREPGTWTGSGTRPGREPETLAWMRQTAARRNAAVAGSIAVGDGCRYFNRFYFVRPDGSCSEYDKRHLFSFAGEDRRYTAGGERVVVEWRGWRILLQVCYDLRFPVFARGRGDYDMILYVANWPTVRIHVWDILLRARAIENLCYAVGVNRTGDDPFASYSGGTSLVNFKGETVAAATPDRHEAVFCEADIGALRAFRDKFPALADADKFTIDHLNYK